MGAGRGLPLLSGHLGGRGHFLGATFCSGAVLSISRLVFQSSTAYRLPSPFFPW